MMIKFKTEIVKTKELNKTFRAVFAILYLISTLYIFLDYYESYNVYFKSLALAIYILGGYLLFSQPFVKARKIGNIEISIEKIEFDINGVNKSILLSELENIYLKYRGYGSWTTHSIFGNKNYLRITKKSGEKYDFEIRIRNKNAKNELKNILNSSEFYEKFDFIKMNNSRTEF